MPYVEVWVDDVDVDKVVEEYGETDWADFVEVHRESILKALGRQDVPDVTNALEDPAKRLEVITWLRSNGWSVEPA